MADLIIGLTGGIGSGKTAASDYLASKGITIVDADVIAREVVEPPSSALQYIAIHFGADILHKDGSLNRKKLREIIFNNRSEKEWLEQLLHPLIRQNIIHQLSSATSEYAILVSPLLLETSQHELVDYIVVLDVDESVQIKRATQRDNSSIDAIKKIIATQMSQEQKQQFADHLINNNGDHLSLHRQLDKLHDYLLTLVKKS